MKTSDFIEEWNKNHTSQPSYQDIIDWCEKYYTERAWMFIEKFCTFLHPRKGKEVCAINKWAFMEFMVDSDTKHK